MAMKSTNQVIKESSIAPKLIRSVIRQLEGKDSLQDIANHGIDGGFCGFVYYRDTVAFFKRNRKEIVSLVESMASDFGEEPINMVANFNCLKPADEETRKSIAKCLYGGRLTDDDDLVANALAWFAGEEVARAFQND